MVDKKELIDNVINITPYTVLYNGTNILRKRPLGSSVIDKIGLIAEETKSHAYIDLKIM